MSNREAYEARTEELITPILERMQFELVDVEYVKEGATWYLRAYIDKEGGITVNDCEAVAREMNEILDREDYIEDSYVFEGDVMFAAASNAIIVGFNTRPDKQALDSAERQGVEIRTYRAIDKKKEFYGILTSYDEKTVTIETEDGSELTLEKADIALIRLAFDF